MCSAMYSARLRSRTDQTPVLYTATWLTAQANIQSNILSPLPVPNGRGRDVKNMLRGQKTIWRIGAKVTRLGKAILGFGSKLGKTWVVRQDNPK